MVVAVGVLVLGEVERGSLVRLPSTFTSVVAFGVEERCVTGKRRRDGNSRFGRVGGFSREVDRCLENVVGLGDEGRDAVGVVAVFMVRG